MKDHRQAYVGHQLLSQPLNAPLLSSLTLIAQFIGTAEQIGEILQVSYSICGTSVATHEKGEIWEGILANKSGHLILSEPSQNTRSFTI
jgi:hypothetical protein